MAEEVQNAASAVPQAEEVVVVADVAQSEKMMTPTPQPPTPPSVAEKEAPPVPETEEEPLTLKPKQVEDATVETELSKPSSDDNDDKIPDSVSFKEESNKVSDLLESEKKALDDFRQLVQQALKNQEFSAPKAAVAVGPAKEEEKGNKEAAEVPAEETKSAEEATTPPPPPEEQPEVVTAAETKDEQVLKGEKIEMVDTEEDQKLDDAAVADDAAGVDDDGAKTVEAIEETIVAVSSSAPEEQTMPEKPEEKSASTMAEEAKDVISEPAEEVSIWGIPLLADERSDVILLKFLRARDFKVRDAFTMLKNTIKWRKDFRIDELVEQDLGNELEKVVFMHGFDKERHPVCYNVYGEFQNKELYMKSFSDEEKRNRFLRWRIQFLERSIRKLDFNPGGISTIVQVNDLKNSPGPSKRELRQATNQALQLLQDNYPEFVAKQVFINVPWWYLAVNRMISPFLTQRTRSKFVFAGPSKSAETLFRYISGEQIPVKYGGLSKDGEFDTADAVTEITVKPAGKHTIEFPVSETCLVSWEVRVVGWEVRYGAEFVPNAEESYTVIIQKSRKVGANEEPVVCNSFKIGEHGKVVITIDNPTSKKKKLLYRFKTKVSSE